MAATVTAAAVAVASPRFLHDLLLWLLLVTGWLVVLLLLVRFPITCNNITVGGLLLLGLLLLLF